ncbi:MAG TPA: hypothetical protein IAD07_10385 [Candidatus Fimivicinus intestinavium]|nr:hypothetical protein [Candidatus Fimivicinus intestinavium]
MGLKNSTVIVTVILCAAIAIFLIFMLWQSHSGTPTLPDDTEDAQSEIWQGEADWDGGNADGNGAEAGSGGAAGGGSSGGQAAGSSGGGSGAVTVERRPVDPEEIAPFEGRQAEPYMRILAGGAYTWDVVLSQKVDGEETEMPLTLTASGKRLCIQMTYSDRISMSILSDGTATYAVLPMLKAYTDLPDSMAGDFKSLNLDFSKFEYVSTLDVTEDGQALVCERYMSDTDRIYFYFSGNTLVKMELRGPGGTMELMVNSLTDQVDASLLSLPEGYKKRNLSFLFR